MSFSPRNARMALSISATSALRSGSARRRPARRLIVQCQVSSNAVICAWLARPRPAEEHVVVGVELNGGSR